MADRTDHDLLRAYVLDRDEDAFRTLVERYAAFVYSASLRQLNNPALAEEVAQTVFIILSRKAGRLGPKVVLAGWLHRATRFAAATACRTEARREQREQEAALMQPTSILSDADQWKALAPEVDAALAHLSDTDRDAVLLRFFTGHDLKQVGGVLGLSEEAAKKRVSRALERMRGFLSRRGVTLSVAALAGTLSVNSVQAAPITIGSSVLTSLNHHAGSTATLALVKATMKAMLHAQLKTAALITGFALAVVAGGTMVAQQAAKPKSALPAAVVAPFDRTTPLGALRDFADALDQSDSNRVMAAMQMESPPARRIGIAMGEAVAAERDFKSAVTARFGNRPVRIINLNFGQSAFKTGEDLSDTVTYTDADHAIVRLPSRSQPEKPHSVQLVRVNGVWKFSDKDTPGMDDGEEVTLAAFRKSTAMMKEVEQEISEGKYRSYDEAVRSLAKRFRLGIQ
jgi:RNA polymerase sigma factor (sigma-70 family)